MNLDWDNYISSSSSSSSCHAPNADLADPLPPLFSIVYRFKATSYIDTELLYVGSCWSPCLCSFMWRDPQEYVTYEFVPTSLAVLYVYIRDKNK